MRDVKAFLFVFFLVVSILRRLMELVLLPSWIHAIGIYMSWKTEKCPILFSCFFWKRIHCAGPIIKKTLKYPLLKNGLCNSWLEKNQTLVHPAGWLVNLLSKLQKIVRSWLSAMYIQHKILTFKLKQTMFNWLIRKHKMCFL